MINYEHITLIKFAKYRKSRIESKVSSFRSCPSQDITSTNSILIVVEHFVIDAEFGVRIVVISSASNFARVNFSTVALLRFGVVSGRPTAALERLYKVEIVFAT